VNSDVVYQLFELTSVKNSKLIIISIANALDMTTRILPNLNNSVEPELLHFEPYTANQIEKILEKILSPLPVQLFEGSALKFVAAKASAKKGDIRVALKVCIKAVESFDSDDLYDISEPIKKITVGNIMEVFSSLSNTLTLQKIPLHQQILLSCIAYLSKTNDKIKLNEVKKFTATKIRELKLESFEKNINDLCSHLEDSGIIDIGQTISTKNILCLKLPYEEIVSSLQDNPLCKRILEE